MSEMMEFEIQDSILVKYRGKDSDVVIPEGVIAIGDEAFLVAYYESSNLTSVVIPDGVTSIGNSAFRDCSKLTSITLPSSVTEIGRFAFSGCHSLHDILIPNSVTSIGRGAFEDCKSITNITLPSGVTCLRESVFKGCNNLATVELPDGLTAIESYAFQGCKNLNSISIPDSVTSIGYFAFDDCKSLSVVFTHSLEAWLTIGFFDTSYANPLCHGADLSINGEFVKDLIIPDGVENIKQSAFHGCIGLYHVTVPESVKQIGDSAFRDCKNLKLVSLHSLACNIHSAAFACCGEPLVFQASDKALQTNRKLNAWITDVVWDREPSNEDLAYIATYQSGKKWIDYLHKRVKDPSAVCSIMLNLFQEDPKAPATAMAGFIEFFARKLTKDQVERAIKLLKQKKYKMLSDIENLPDVKDILSGEAFVEHPIEAIVREYLSKHPLNEEARKAVEKGIPYADTGKLSSREAVAVIISQYANEISKHLVRPQDAIGITAGIVNDGTKIAKHQEADQIGSALDQKALSDYLQSMLDKPTYRTYLLAWARFATNESIERITSSYKTLIRGNARDRYWAQNLREVLLINDSLSVTHFFDRIGDLERYAKMRGMTAMEMRDSVMLPDFGFDADGIKRFDIGGNMIEVSITPELGFRLYDVNAQKEIRSFPKKSNDPKKAEACAKEFAEFKKAVLDFAKSRTELIHKMHISGEYINPELWRKVYVDHSVIRHLAKLLIWEDEAKNTFMIDNGSIVDKQNNPYAPQGKIRVAHVLDMNQQDIADWQQMLVKTGKKQLFEQVWEPVISWDKNSIQGRYEGMVLTYKERNELKKALKIRGIEAGSGDMSREYHPRTGYTFSDEGEMIIGTCLRIDYKVDPDQEILTFKNSWLCNANAAREMNAVLLEVDKAAVKSFIVKDNTNALTKGLLGNFTAAQISSFVSLAIDSKATGCTAVLLDYKNTHFPEFADVNEFSLDW